MAKKKQENRKAVEESIEIAKTPRCAEISAQGIRTGHDFANMMSSLMSDLVDGRVTPQQGNAICNAGGKLLKVVEMKYKYGTNGPGSADQTLVLSEG